MASPSAGRLPRCVYVNCFGSHRCGSAILYEGRGSWRLRRLEAGGSPAEPALPETPGGPGASRASSRGTPAPGAREPPELPGQAGRRRPGRPSRRALPGPDSVSDIFELYIPLNEAAKITKKKKKIQKRSCSILDGPFKHAVWDSVYKVISKMLNENEKIRDRMNFKQGCVENGDLAQSTEEESSHL
ncbi:uncharacterized protein C5orf47 homolog [Macrotis lagotis]|uniref:uncharacterized protein C5orf47 homolog n=1 Tax=Macrotis lagotis TaxID=92651 RepID=UPI003D6922FF